MEKYLVQWRDESGEWINIQTFGSRARAIEVFMEESMADPEHPHRVVEVTEMVVASIHGL